MTDEEFSHYIDQAVETLPDEFKSKLSNVAILMDDFPNPQQMRRAGLQPGRGLLFGLYEGIPQHRRGNYYGVGMTYPDRITIFKQSLLLVSRSKEELINRIHDTVLHEIGHHFGMNEEEIRRAEASRRSRKK